MLASACLLSLAAAVAAKHCIDLSVPLSLTSRNAVFKLDVPKTEIEVTNLVLDLTRNGHNFTKSVTTGFTTIKKDYKIAARYCRPDGRQKDRRVLQIATHGIGFDHSYWDLPYQNFNYSYVDRALARGYSVLSWDRLGIAKSSHGDPVNEIQLFLEIAALKALTEWVKAGHLDGGRHKRDKLVHIGHSYGSAITFGMTNANPELSNAIVLTGFNQVAKFLPQFLLGANFVSAKDVKPLADKYSHGYLATKSLVGLMTNFFSPRSFDPAVLKIAAKNGQPAAIGELLTLLSLPAASNFRGAAIIVTGDRDLPFCGGDCKSAASVDSSVSDLLEVSRKNFRSASVFKSAVIPEAGHGLNYHYQAPLAYKAILDFTDAHL